MFDTGTSGNDFTTAIRQNLDGTSWVEIVPGWLTNPERLFDELRDTVPFEQHQRWMYDRKVDEPRLTAEYADITKAPRSLQRIAEALSEHYEIEYDGVWLNLYRDNRDSAGWHGDWITCKRERCIVPVLSLGATRRFLLKPKEGGRSIGFSPQSGDLVVMGGRCQRDWRHSVPRQARTTGPRISLNFQSTLQMTSDGAQAR